MWNLIDLKCPSDDMVEYEAEMGFIEELRDIVNIFTTAANILTSENPVFEEMSVLRNIQVKHKILLRCDKCLVYLHRVSHCLKKMVLLDLSKSYLDLAERFLTGFSSQNSNFVRLPSQQQVEYMLIRTLSAAKLLCDGIKYSRETFCFLLQKIKVGHMILDLVMAASASAKLVVLLKAILEQMCDVYQQILPWSLKLKRGNYQWADKLNLPKDMKMWLESYASAALKPIPMSQNALQKISSLLNTSDQKIDSDSDSVIVVEEVNSNGNHVSNQNQNENSIDYGEVIPREKRKSTDGLTIEQKALLHRTHQVQNIEDLEDLWKEIKTTSSTYLPKVLSKGKKKVISKFFSRIREKLSKKNARVIREQPKFLKKALQAFSKHLGFTENQIEMCHNEQAVSNDPSKNKLEPVTTLKELKLLYKHLCTALQFSNQFEKCQKLQKIFKRRRTDIRLLKQNGEKNTAKKLVYCTSKVFLTLCQK